jgi:transcriptional regulator with XRE-family HTH domain
MAGDFYERLGAAIRERRIALGLSQAVLGERIGLGRTSITMIELGSQALQVHQLFGIAAALKVSPDALLKKVEIPEAAGPSREIFQTAEARGLLAELDEPIGRLTR